MNSPPPAEPQGSSPQNQPDPVPFVSQPMDSAKASSLLASIIESSDDAIISKDLTGIITSWNQAAQRLFGYTGPEIIGKSILTLIPPHLRNEEPEILARMNRGERIDHYETLRRRKDGSSVEVSLTIWPVKDERGVIVGISKVIRDLTATREADRAMRLLAAIVDSSDDAIVSKDLNGVVTSWNAGAARIFGYTAEEMIGRPIAVLFPPDRVHEEPQILERLKRGERVDHYQTVRVRKNGEHFDISVTISPIKDATGKVIGASKVARDITREKQWLAQLATANEELKRADRMKSEFLAIMSHELRTPLNSIIGFASVLRQGRSGSVSDEQKKQLNLIHASGKYLLHLINDLLDLSRIEAGRLDLDCEDFSPADVIQEAIRSLELQIAQKGLVVRTKVETTQYVHTDRKRFFQVLLNLINNAVKFTPTGSIDIHAFCEADKLVVSITDTGIGIAKDKQKDLFQAFSQVEGSSRRRYEGTGLGLYLCKKIVAMLGGEITVASETNRGSVFTFRIALQSVSTPHPYQIAEPTQA
jgi:PAS domain S-box-containing protein